MIREQSHYQSSFHMEILSNKQRLFAYVFLMQNKINSTSVRGSYWYPSISESSPFYTHCFMFRNLAPRPFSQIKHVLVLGSEVSWPSDNVLIVTGCSIRIKEVINQLTGLWGQYCSLQGKQCSHSQHWVLTGETTAQLPHAATDNMKPMKPK